VGGGDGKEKRKRRIPNKFEFYGGGVLGRKFRGGRGKGGQRSACPSLTHVCLVSEERRLEGKRRKKKGACFILILQGSEKKEGGGTKIKRKKAEVSLILERKFRRGRENEEVIGRGKKEGKEKRDRAHSHVIE